MIMRVAVDKPIDTVVETMGGGGIDILTGLIFFFTFCFILKLGL